MAKFVEHGRHIVKAYQSRLAVGRLCKIADIVDNRLGTQQFRLPYHIFHPGAAVLIVAFEIITVEQANSGTIFIEQFKYAHVFLINRNVLALFKGNTIQLRSGIENTVLQNAVQYEVWFDLAFIQVVTGFAHLVGIINSHRRVDWAQDPDVENAIKNDIDDYIFDVIRGEHNVPISTEAIDALIDRLLMVWRRQAA